MMSGLVGSLQERGHDVSLICLDDGTHDRYAVHPGVRRIYLDAMSDGHHPVGPIRRVRALRASIQDAFPDVVLSFCDVTNLLVLLATRRLRIPVVVCERSDPRRQRLSMFREWLRTRLYRRATQVVAQTSEVSQYLSGRLRREVNVIGSAIRNVSGGDRKIKERGENPKVIVTVGRCEREKGWDRLIDAVAALPNAMEWRLILVGDGSLRSDLETRADEKNVKRRLEWVGWSQRVEYHLQRADLFVLPSRYEGYPSALLEAMSLGLPVVAFDASPGIRDCVEHGNNGLLVTNQPPEDIPALRDAITRVLTDGELRQRLRKNALRSARSHDWDEMVDHFERVLLAAAAVQ